MNEVVILIADDDAGVCLAYRSLLSSLGCIVNSASTLSETLSTMQRQPADFVFLDLHFPDASATKTIEIGIPGLRAFNPKCAVIVMTGMLDEKIEQMATTIGGAEAFRLKPEELSSQEDFWSALEEALTKARAKGQDVLDITTKVLTRIQCLREQKSPKDC